jgi:hypothetical protein
LSLAHDFSLPDDVKKLEYRAIPCLFLPLEPLPQYDLISLKLALLPLVLSVFSLPEQT